MKIETVEEQDSSINSEGKENNYCIKTECGDTQSGLPDLAVGQTEENKKSTEITVKRKSNLRPIGRGMCGGGRHTAIQRAGAREKKNAS